MYECFLSDIASPTTFCAVCHPLLCNPKKLRDCGKGIPAGQGDDVSVIISFVSDFAYIVCSNFIHYFCQLLELAFFPACAQIVFLRLQCEYLV